MLKNLIVGHFANARTWCISAPIAAPSVLAHVACEETLQYWVNTNCSGGKWPNSPETYWVRCNLRHMVHTMGVVSTMSVPKTDPTCPRSYGATTESCRVWSQLFRKKQNCSQKKKLFRKRKNVPRKKNCSQEKTNGSQKFFLFPEKKNVPVGGNKFPQTGTDSQSWDFVRKIGNRCTPEFFPICVHNWMTHREL